MLGLQNKNFGGHDSAHTTSYNNKMSPWLRVYYKLDTFPTLLLNAYHSLQATLEETEVWGI